MRIMIDSNTLNSAIERAENVMIKNNKLPILDSILLSAKEGKIQLTATTLDSSIIIDVEGDIVTTGEITIDKSNFKLIKKLSGYLNISDENEKNVVEIKSNRNLKFKCQDSKGFPNINITADQFAFSVIEKDFKNSLKIKKMASCDENRPVLNSLCIHNNSVVAIDGYRLAKIDLHIENQALKDIIIPLPSINELDKILNNKSNKVLEFRYSTNKENKIDKITITGEDYIYIARTFDGEYMKVESIIPKDFIFEVDINRKAMLESVEFAKEILTEKKPVILDINKDLTVRANSDDKQFDEIIITNLNINEADYHKKGFNPKYLAEALKTVTDEVLNFKFAVNGRVSPVVITTVNELYMILPCSLN